MIQPNEGTVAYVNANKKYQKIGIAMGGRGKVAHFETTLDEVFQVGDRMIVTAVRAEDITVYQNGGHIES